MQQNEPQQGERAADLAQIKVDLQAKRDVSNVWKIGHAGEVRVQKLFTRSGWQAGLQPGSGAIGSRNCSAHLTGDVWAKCGSASVRVEVKHLRREPALLQSLRGGADVLAYWCSATNRLGFLIDEGLFVDLIAWAAELEQVRIEAQRDDGWNGRIATRMKKAMRAHRWPASESIIDGEIARERLLNVLPELDSALVLALYYALADGLGRRR